MNFCLFNSTRTSTSLLTKFGRKTEADLRFKVKLREFYLKSTLFCSLFLFILIRCLERDQGYVKALFYPLCLYLYNCSKRSTLTFVAEALCRVCIVFLGWTKRQDWHLFIAVHLWIGVLIISLFSLVIILLSSVFGLLMPWLAIRWHYKQAIWFVNRMGLLSV